MTINELVKYTSDWWVYDVGVDAEVCVCDTILGSLWPIVFWEKYLILEFGLKETLWLSRWS